MADKPELSGLPRLVIEELGLLRQFVSALTSEQALLVAGDIDRLPPILAEKSRLAASLGEFANRRNQALASAGLETDKAGMEVWLAGQDQPTRSAWNDILGLARDARRENEINGNLIKTRMQHNQQALSVLQAASKQALLYGPDGQQRPAEGGRDFGVA